MNEYYPMNVLNEYELTTASVIVIVIDNTKEGTLKQVWCVRMMTRRMFSFGIVLYGGLTRLFLSWVWIIIICIDSPFFASYSLWIVIYLSFKDLSYCLQLVVNAEDARENVCWIINDVRDKTVNI